MAVQKSKKSKAKTKTRSAGKFATPGVVSVDHVTGVSHLRHHTAGGYYRGKRVYKNFNDIESKNDTQEQTSSSDDKE
tara:strand:+ start:166 stop:396 length:231 start_codon:yes stop_codon:yes gene_type:complete